MFIYLIKLIYTKIGEILEYGAVLSVQAKDISSFERYIAQVKTYYYDFG